MTDAAEVTKPSERAAQLDPSRPIITISEVGKAYPPRKKKKKPNVVLEDVELQVRPGEFVSLVGASGCGKTTLLRMIGGLTSYFPGEIHVKGQLVRGIPPRIGFVFQDSALMPWRTVWQNVKVGLNERRREFSRQEISEKVEAALGLVGLLEYRDYLPRQISGGMQQRTGLARALVGEPDVLLMDEPFGALDALTRSRLQEELAAIVLRTSATTVFVTHDVDEAVFLSDRVAVMSTETRSILEVIDIDVPRPRLVRAELFADLHVADLRRRVLDLVIGPGHESARPGPGS
jgi:ABC-type nitrate/sulfonate/bicarbonate transport system ATPase subunit